jgi:hypothetical protein
MTDHEMFGATPADRIDEERMADARRDRKLQPASASDLDMLLFLGGGIGLMIAMWAIVLRDLAAWFGGP